MKQKLKIAKKIAKVGNNAVSFSFRSKNQSKFKTAIYIQNNFFKILYLSDL